MFDVKARKDFNACIVGTVMRTWIVFVIDRLCALLSDWAFWLQAIWTLSVLPKVCLFLPVFDIVSCLIMAHWPSIDCGVPLVVCPNVSQQTEIVFQMISVCHLFVRWVGLMFRQLCWICCAWFWRMFWCGRRFPNWDRIKSTFRPSCNTSWLLSVNS